ncbi:glycosyltransferase [Actibacterium sp. XHP0104]|uniref:glycosyltransferase n=1 Tax=Actibacterium sp. XHP0104 TaxID=2984335 RepID=UPI00298152FE|nr:glycosyltransferase [Actibacterium sp. XHP0104]
MIIAARNEEAYIADCLRAVLAQDDVPGGVEVIVAANACTDRTADVARSLGPDFTARGWALQVIEVPTPGKINALNAGDAMATGRVLVFLDADVRCDPPLLAQLAQALDTDAPRYATGTLQVMPARTWVTRQYASLWTRLPFVKGGAVGAGLFAVNRAGRARWGAFPDIISDDTYVRMQFTPDERIELPARYHWPMVEGLGNLIRVRKRQDAGVQEIHHKYPDLPDREGKGHIGAAGLARLFVTVPAGFVIYALVHIAVRLRPAPSDWTRGR